MKKKKRGFGLEIATKISKDGQRYLFFKTLKGSVHAFVEVEAKDALAKCGARRRRGNKWLTTRQMAYDLLRV